MYEIIFFIIGFEIGKSFNGIHQRLRRIQDSLLERSVPHVVNPSPEAQQFLRKESSFIVEPKSPQLVEFEQAEELRKLNPGKF